MGEYKIKVELLSDTIFGSGKAVPGEVNLEVLYNEYGLPYLKAKTLKGKLKEEARHVCKCLNNGIENIEWIQKLFGKTDDSLSDTIKFSDLEVESDIRQAVKQAVLDEKQSLSKQDILNSMTSVRTFISIEGQTGSTKKGSLRRIRVINRGFYFYSTISIKRTLSEIEEIILAASVASLRYLGTMETRGKGRVRCRLYKEGKDITDEKLDLLKEVEL